MLILLSSIALAGWTVTPTDGSLAPEAKAAIEKYVAHCPVRQQDWVVRYDDTGLARLGPVSNGEDSDLGAIEACLRAGLETAPPPGPMMLKLSWGDPRVEVWQAKLLAVLDPLAGKGPGGCATVRFDVGVDGRLLNPVIAGPSVEPAFDTHLMSQLFEYTDPLPHLPEALQALFPEHIEVCVSGTDR